MLKHKKKLKHAYPGSMLSSRLYLPASGQVYDTQGTNKHDYLIKYAHFINDPENWTTNVA